MARNETVRLKPAILAADLDAFAALQKMTDYAPANDDFAVAAITPLQAAMIEKQNQEAQAAAALAAARDDSVAAEWAVHNAMLGATAQVAAQYGPNSNEYQSMGRKKKTEYKTPQRKPKPPQP